MEKNNTNGSSSHLMDSTLLSRACGPTRHQARVPLTLQTILVFSEVIFPVPCAAQSFRRLNHTMRAGWHRWFTYDHMTKDTGLQSAGRALPQAQEHTGMWDSFPGAHLCGQHLHGAARPPTKSTGVPSYSYISSDLFSCLETFKLYGP